MSSKWCFIIKNAVALVLVGCLAGIVTYVLLKYRQEHRDPRPHIVVVLADDLVSQSISQ